jgi:hypothetical protein
MTKELRFGHLRHDEINKFQTFIREHWKSDHIFSKDTTVFDWQHKGREYYHCIAATKATRIVGVQCVIPLWHFDENLENTEIFLSLFRAIDKEGIGIGLRLYRKVLAVYSPKFVGSVGLTERMIPFHKRFGFVFGEMDHHVLLSPYRRNYKIAVVPSTVSVKEKACNSSIFLRSLDKKDLKSIANDRLYSYQVPRKSSAYVISRYLDHPVYTYRVYGVIENGSVQAFGVIRLVAVNGSIAHRLVDYLGPDKYIVDFFLGAQSILKECDGEYVDFYSYGISKRLFKKVGVLNRREIRGLVIPDHFEPFKQNNRDIHFAFDAVENASDVRLFKGDGDQDRPSRLLEP